MNNFLKITAFFLLTASLIACRPFSKESYLEKYSKFISDVSDKGGQYTDNDWTKADEEYKKFSEDWYDHFKDELTWQEKLTTTKYTVQFSYYRNKPGALDLYKTYIKGDLEKLKEKIKYYKENNMNADIDSLIKQAKVLGDSSVQVVQGLIKDAEKELNDKK